MSESGNTPTNLPPVTYAPRPPRLRRPPAIMVAVGLVSVVASWVPLVIFARARTIPKDNPRIQPLQDMGMQPKFREQQSNALFADGRADRLPVPGTVARGQAQEDGDYYLGYTRKGRAHQKRVNSFAIEFPKEVTLDDALIRRGRDRFNIYCSACHGLDGHGHGAVNERALELQGDPANYTAWTPAADLTAGEVPKRPVGHIYNTINVGIRSMPGYGAQITDPHDRWAIVAWVRVLQTAQPSMK